MREAGQQLWCMSAAAREIRREKTRQPQTKNNGQLWTTNRSVASDMQALPYIRQRKVLSPHNKGSVALHHRADHQSSYKPTIYKQPHVWYKQSWALIMLKVIGITTRLVGRQMLWFGTCVQCFFLKMTFESINYSNLQHQQLRLYGLLQALCLFYSVGCPDMYVHDHPWNQLCLIAEVLNDFTPQQTT